YRDAVVSVDHRLNRASCVDHALNLVERGIVVTLSLQSVIARKVDHVIGSSKSVHPPDAVIYIGLVNWNTQIGHDFSQGRGSASVALLSVIRHVADIRE